MTNKKLSEKIIQIEDRLAGIGEGMATRADVNGIMTVLDAIAKSSNIMKDEARVIGARTERMERWMALAARKIGVPYDR